MPLAVFVPLLVTRFYYTSGLCSTLPSPDIPPSELKRTCRQAFALASALSGVIQLCALLLSPVAGLACDALSAPVTLLITSALGTASFLALGVGLPGEGDPRAPIAWVAAVGIGACQIGAIVGSMALCAQARRMEGGKGGAIAGCYSFFGKCNRALARVKCTSKIEKYPAMNAQLCIVFLRRSLDPRHFETGRTALRHVRACAILARCRSCGHHDALGRCGGRARTSRERRLDLIPVCVFAML